MITSADGIQGIMNLFLTPGSNRHSAFDSDVVFHEFTHGVSSLLVGGRLDARGLMQPQSRALSEGWSDYFALTVQNYFLDREKTVIGDWVKNRPGGFRIAPYNDDYPGTFGQIGKPGPYQEDKPHVIGQIWAAALMKMNRDLGTALGHRQLGHLLGWQIVVDGFKLTPANPSFLDARDAILQALNGQMQSARITEADFIQAGRALWGAFSRFGIGSRARSIGASLVDIIEDFDLPPGI